MLFGIRGESCLASDSVASFLDIDKVGFSEEKERRTLWTCATFAILWVIWLERNDRIFRSRRVDPIILWERVKFLASLWAKASSAFAETSLPDLQQDNWIPIFSLYLSCISALVPILIPFVYQWTTRPLLVTSFSLIKFYFFL